MKRRQKLSKKWNKMRPTLAVLFLLLGDHLNAQTPIPMTPVQMSEQLLQAVKNQEDAQPYVKGLAGLTEEALSVGLGNDTEKLVFWINVYNAFIQYKLKQDTSQFENRRKFFKKRDIVIAGRVLSFDDIEHGLIRRSKVKWAGGYLQRLFPSDFEKKHRVSQLDWRIHFALNCGAAGCPAVDFYTVEALDKQLENGVNLFLMFESEYDSTSNVMTLPKLFSWYRKDFGGKKGIYEILEKREYIPAGSQPKLKYSEYDWQLSVANYR